MKKVTLLLGILSSTSFCAANQVSEAQQPFIKRYENQKSIIAPEKARLNSEPEPDLSEGFVSLYNGKDLSNWTARGGYSTFEARADRIVGTCLRGSPSTYLSTLRDDYNDFIFSAELKWVIDGNSGIMFRAQHEPEQPYDRVFGPQCEMEGFAPILERQRGWSGGIYGQGYAAWIYPLWLEAHSAVRQALKKDAWNRITIKAVKGTVKTWVNGLPAAHWVDDQFLKGFFGLQLHSGKQGEVHFRNIKFKELNNLPEVHMADGIKIGEVDSESGNQKKNVLLICVDDLRPELNCFGVDYIHSPNIDRLAASGRAFLNHYVNAPTCGASRYSLLTGDYYPEAKNYALFDRAKQLNEGGIVRPSLPAWFRQQGYTTLSIGKVSHHPGGLGGKDWDDPSIVEMPNSWDLSLQPIGDWQHPRGVMHALAEGKIWGSGEILSVFEAFDGNDQSYPDGLIAETAIKQINKLDASGSPFFMAVGFIRPHLPFGAPKKYLDLYADCELPTIAHPNKPKHPSSWTNSGEFMRYNRWSRNPITDPAFADEVRRHYAACVSYVDAQVGLLMDQLDRSGMRENTIVVLWGDHGWHLGEYGVWGKHTLFEESLRSPLIISYDNIVKPGEPSTAIVETVDILPTICDLAQIPAPAKRAGTNLNTQLKDPGSLGHSALAFQRNRITIRNKQYRLIVHKSGFRELYDFSDPNNVSINRAQELPEVVNALEEQLNQRLTDTGTKSVALW